VTVRSLGEKVPRLAATAWVSEAAYVVGDVELGEGSSVWPGAVVRGDFAPIRVGRNTVIEDNCVVHTGEPMWIGDNDIIGHAAVVHCARVGSNCLIGNHATLLDGAVIGDYCLVASGALVLGNVTVPDRSFVVGAPARVEPLSEVHLGRLEGQGGPANAELGYGYMMRVYRDAGL
jgi:carbonic anhydrase/acetyltransferase-like protein (isoleucine patch superfamily)